MSTVITPEEIQANLGQFSGSETFTPWSPLFRNSVLTEGALYVAENCGAYWLMDIIGSYQHEAKFKKQDFQVWKLKTVLSLKMEKTWLVTAEDGNENALARQSIEYSDFPLNGIEIWAIRNELGGLTLMLPSEY
jgi:hypothetical protein